MANDARAQHKGFARTAEGTKYLLAMERAFWLVAVGLVVFLLGRWHVSGLQPDAALYAGLAKKIQSTQEYWLLSGTEGRFPAYFEHPPYFFQWGAQLFAFAQRLGLAESDALARAMGAIPGLLAFCALLGWVWIRMGWTSAALGALMLSSFGHYTKYASTAMLEAPLSLGVVLTAIAVFELHWHARQRFKRPLFWLLLLSGLLISTASKGVAGLGAWGGLLLSAGTALFLSERHAFKNFVGLFFLLPCLLVALSPLGFWMWQLWRHEGGEVWIHGYLTEQVWRSFFTDRGEATAAPAASPFYYVWVLLRDSWPWGWSVAAVWVSLLLLGLLPKRLQKRWQGFARLRAALDVDVLRAWNWNAMAFFFAFALPFSLSRYKLPHYLHPTYLVLAPVGIFFLASLLPQKLVRGWAQQAPLRWGVLLLVFVALRSFSSETAGVNRGQKFQAVMSQVRALPEECRLRVPAEQMDPYQMEAYGLWYFNGRPWELSEKPIPSKIAVPKGVVYWEPKSGTLWGNQTCAVR